MYLLTLKLLIFHFQTYILSVQVILMRKIIFILTIAFFSSDCTADARVLAELLAKANARSKAGVLKYKNAQKKTKPAISIPKNVKPKQVIAKKAKDIVTSEQLEVRDSLAYLPNQDKPFTGKHKEFHSNKKKYVETDYKDGKKNGSLILWDEYEHKVGQLTFINGRYLEN
jgi:antitoxin component YwqK of YwqJK toxin-antitoxin module